MPGCPDLIEENRRLREAIAEARRLLNGAAAGLREILDEEALLEEIPLEVEAEMLSATDAIEAASRSLTQSTAKRTVSPMPGGPTRQQGQFLAYIRVYMMLHHRSMAPTHAELQEFFNLTPPSVNSMLKRLDEKGFIRRTRGKARAIELTIRPELIPPLDRPFTQ